MRELNYSRKQNRAFSGYARGKFLAIPCGHCSLPPRLRRLIHENLAALRFSVSIKVLYFIIIYCAFQNHNFGLAHSNCRILTACAEKVKRWHLTICVPLKMPPRGKLRTPHRLENGARWGCPQSLGISQATARREMRELLFYSSCSAS